MSGTPDIPPFFSRALQLEDPDLWHWMSDWRRLKREPGYSSRLCLLRLQTIPVCSFELKPSFS